MTARRPSTVVTSDTHQPISPEVVEGASPYDRPQGTPQTNLAELDLLARMMDSAIEIPGTGIRLGFDAFIGLLPVVGDMLTSLVSLYIIQRASELGVSKVTLARMAANIGVDCVVGSIPVVGDAFDVVWKANVKNIELLKQATAGSPKEKRRQMVSDWVFLAGIAALLICLIAGSLTVSYLILRAIGRLLFI